LVTGLSNGIFTVTVSDNIGCSKTHTVVVNTNPNPIANAGTDKKIKTGEQIQLQALGGINYNWHPSAGLDCWSCSNPIANPGNTTTYYVIVSDDNGCTSMDSVIVELESICTDLFIPNVFSPNNDGQNDVFKIYGSCVKEAVLTIYDQWGEKIFDASGDSPNWDGTYKGREFSSDVFMYKAKIILVTGDEISKTGNISLVK